MDRRQFLGAAAAGATVAMTSMGMIRAEDDQQETGTGETLPKFALKYAPHLGMFREHGGSDPLDQIAFMADEGFTALEDNGMARRPPELQEKIGRKLQELGMTMGVFVAHAEFGKVTFASDDPGMRDRLVAQMKDAVKVGKRAGARWCTVVPGAYHKRLEWDYQTANVIENLKRCAEVCEPHGLAMVLEPLNPFRDHPGLFLTKVPQAYMICRSVGSPSCKILDDLYHQQITEGNLIPNIDRAWEEIAYFQVGDNPGRKEPTTGEINYLNIFRHLKKKGFEGVVGMEHGNSQPGKKGERAVIDAYRECDQ